MRIPLNATVRFTWPEKLPRSAPIPSIRITWAQGPRSDLFPRMNAETKIGAILRALALAVLLATIAMWSSNAAAQAPDPMFVASMGAEDALVTVIEYGSLASVDTAEFLAAFF